jgi:hypothetical protein
MSTDALTISLEAAVPLWIDKHKHTSVEARIARARELADVVAGHGDDILFRSKRKGESAKAFNALAEGLALMAYQPGGVSFAGEHWEAQP